MANVRIASLPLAGTIADDDVVPLDNVAGTSRSATIEQLREELSPLPSTLAVPDGHVLTVVDEEVSWQAVPGGGGGGGTGDVVGPDSSADRQIPVYDGITGELLTTAPITVSTDGAIEASPNPLGNGWVLGVADVETGSGRNVSLSAGHTPAIGESGGELVLSGGSSAEGAGGKVTIRAGERLDTNVRGLVEVDANDFAAPLVRMVEQSTDPASPGSNAGVLYLKSTGGVVQLFYRGGDGTIHRVTPLPGSELALEITDGGTILHVGPAVLGQAAYFKGAASDDVGGSAGAAVLFGGHGYASADGGDVFVQGGQSAAGAQGKVRLGDLYGSEVLLGRDGVPIKLSHLTVTGDGSGDVNLEMDGLGGSLILPSGTYAPALSVGALTAPAATTSVPGLMSAVDKTKLDKLETTYRAITTTGGLGVTDRVVGVSTSAGAVVLTLPNPAFGFAAGAAITIKKTSTDTSTISLARFGTEQIEGVAATYLLPGSAGTGRPAWTVYWDGANWWVI